MSELQQLLQKTGLDKLLTELRTGGTFFAPTNKAFEKLDAQVNCLMSNDGENNLKKALEYHVVVNRTVWSDGHMTSIDEFGVDVGKREREVEDRGSGIVRYLVMLPTALKGNSMSVDVRR